jgi:hypothetical protein
MLHPYPLEKFLSETRGKTCCHVPGEPDRFADLLTWPRLNAILREHRWDYPRIRVALDAGFPSPDEYLRYQMGNNGQRIARPDAVKLNNLLRKGATVILDSVDEILEPVGRLAESTESHLRETVQVNAYASWGASPGFGLDPHVDDHDVLIIQVAGRKRWLIYGPAESGAGENGPAMSAGPNAQGPSEPLWDRVLEPGGLLYLPRHWWHAVTPLAEPTLHLTFGFRNRTGNDFLAWFQQEVRALPQLARDLPRSAAPEARAAHMASLRDTLLAAASDQALERYLALQDGASLPRPRFSLPWSATPEVLPPDDDARVQWIAPRAFLRGGAGSEAVEVWANGERWQFARAAEAVLHPLLDGAPHAIGELCARSEGALTPKRARSFLAQMLLLGLIAVVEAPEQT